MSLYRKPYILLFIFVIPCIVYAQKTADLKGKYVFYIDEKENITFAEARQKAIDNAKIEALKECFGSFLTSDIVCDMTVSDDGKSHTSLKERSQESIKGEWIGDKKPPIVEISYNNDTHTFAYNVTVEGKGREIVGNKTNVDWHVLCGGTTLQNEKSIFPNKSNVYVKFKSPVKGYLAIYLLSDDDDANCLLPYRNSEDGIFEVSANKDYVFFDKNSDSNADRYILSTSDKTENNIVYLVFSPNKFTKCNDISVDPLHPNKLSVKDFEKWRLKCMQNDSQMIADKKWITIKNAD